MSGPETFLPHTPMARPLLRSLSALVTTRGGQIIEARFTPPLTSRIRGSLVVWLLEVSEFGVRELRRVAACSPRKLHAPPGTRGGGVGWRESPVLDVAAAGLGYSEPHPNSATPTDRSPQRWKGVSPTTRGQARTPGLRTPLGALGAPAHFRYSFS